MNLTPVVKQLLIINIIFFIGAQLVGNAAEELLALFYVENPAFKFWQPLSSMFMHANLMHIAFNMFALYSFGSALEHFWGGGKFLFFYMSCGIGSALIFTGVNYLQFHSGLDALAAAGFDKQQIMQTLASGMQSPAWQQALGPVDFDRFIGTYIIPALGASGAIYGLLVAFAYMFPNAELSLLFLPIPIKAKYFVPGLLCIDLFFGLQGASLFGGGGTGIAHFAHIGGAIIGFIMMWTWRKNQFNKNRWD